MRTTLLILLIALSTACKNSDIGPHLNANLALQRTGPTTVLIKVHVKNLGARATVPLDVEVTAPSQPVIHPAPFVLNHDEARDLQTSLVGSIGLRATLTVKEAERGLTVVTKTVTLE